MTNKIKYIVEVNGKVVKSGFARVDNKKLHEFEIQLLSEYRKSYKDDVQVLFR